MDIVEIKNMHTKEITELRNALNAELRFRENIGKEIDDNEQLKSAFRLKESLDEELKRCETMTDRVIVRKDIREVNQKIHELTKERVMDYVDEFDRKIMFS
jgi:tRNA U34 5-carboxymethylaminomethyl modifying GTPase MnmE/TrmE